MSSNKNFSESTTYRYALALYELAKESSNLEKIEEEVMSLIELISLNADFRSLINDPTGKKKEQINIIRIICEKYKFSCCGFNKNIINSDIINKIKKHNLITTIYSKKNFTPREAKELWSMGVKSIFIDDPSEFKIS